ncbi:MAG: hypothetical protein F4Y12_08020 [Acidimicrobiaceae bacterium]|nr:hypothetical protein [Acidimicrobiaceae bacterium]
MEELAGFRRELDDTYGYYAQVNAAIGFFRDDLDKKYGQLLGPDSPVRFGVGDANRPDASYRHERTYSEVVADFSRHGRLQAVHIRSVIVLIVALWEDTYRCRIANELQLENKNDLKSDVFHDLNRYRQGILHRYGTLGEEPKVLHYIRKGQEVLLTSDDMEQLFSTIVDELNKIGEEHYGQNPDFRFKMPLHGHPSAG